MILPISLFVPRRLPSCIDPHFSRFDKVQINGHAPTSFGHSPLPFLYPHSSKLDGVTKTLHACLQDKIKACEKKWEHVNKRELAFCLGAGNRKCLEEYGARFSLTCSECLLDCLFQESKIGACYFTCFERHLEHPEKPSGVVYTHNP